MRNKNSNDSWHCRLYAVWHARNSDSFNTFVTQDRQLGVEADIAHSDANIRIHVRTYLFYGQRQQIRMLH